MGITTVLRLALLSKSMIVSLVFPGGRQKKLGHMYSVYPVVAAPMGLSEELWSILKSLIICPIAIP